MDILEWVAIFIESVILILGLKIALDGKKEYGWGIFLTFGIYLIYDISKVTFLDIPQDILYILYFVAICAALYSVWEIYEDVFSNKQIKPLVKKHKLGSTDRLV